MDYPFILKVAEAPVMTIYTVPNLNKLNKRPMVEHSSIYLICLEQILQLLEIYLTISTFKGIVKVVACFFFFFLNSHQIILVR